MREGRRRSHTVPPIFPIRSMPILYFASFPLLLFSNQGENPCSEVGKAPSSHSLAAFRLSCLEFRAWVG